MELTSLEQKEVILDTLEQIKDAINNLTTWNKNVHDMNELLKSPNGMQAVAGNCMLIMAIAEGFKKIDKKNRRAFAFIAPRDTMEAGFWPS